MKNPYERMRKRLAAAERAKQARSARVSVRIPLLGTIDAANVELLATKARRRIVANDYGASAVGSDWPIRNADGTVVATLCYNGRIIHA